MDRNKTVNYYRPERPFIRGLGVALFLIAAIVVAAIVAAFVVATNAFGQDCPPGVAACKVLVLTPEEEAVLTQRNGLLDAAKWASPRDIGQIADHFRERIRTAPPGNVPKPPATGPATAPGVQP